MADALANVEAERAFLAALAAESVLASPASARALLDASLVTPERLSLPAHAAVLGEMRRLLDAGHPADAAALRAGLAASQVVTAAGGVAWLVETLDQPPIAAQVPELADAIRRAALRRTLAGHCRRALASAQDPEVDPAALLQELTSTLAGITLSRRTVRSLSEVLLEAVDELEARLSGKAATPPTTGLVALDQVLGGLPPTLVVVGAMPAVGKSALLATITQAIAKSGRTVGVFSLEDEARWIAWRLWSDESGVPQFVLRNRTLSGTQQERAHAGLGAVGAYSERVLVDDRSGVSPRELVLTARDMIVNRGAAAIVVDHLGELRLEAKHRDRHDLEIADALSDLREIANRHHVPVVVATHLRRRDGLKVDTEPQITDFAFSAAVERKARVALGLSRATDSDVLRVSVLKNTNGQAGRAIDFRFKGVAAMVRDCEGAPPADPYADQREDLQ